MAPRKILTLLSVLVLFSALYFFLFKPIGSEFEPIAVQTGRTVSPDGVQAPLIIETKESSNPSAGQVSPFPHKSPSFDERMDQFLAAHPVATLSEAVAAANEAVKEVGLGMPFRLTSQTLEASVRTEEGALFLLGPPLVDKCDSAYTVIPVARFDHEKMTIVTADQLVRSWLDPNFTAAQASLFDSEGELATQVAVPFNSEPWGADPDLGEIFVAYFLSEKWADWWFNARPAAAPETRRPFLVVVFAGSGFRFTDEPRHYRREPWDKQVEFDSKVVLSSPFTRMRLEITNSCFSEAQGGGL